MIWHLRFLFRFLRAVATGIPGTWELHTWSRYSKGYVRDQLQDISWLWQDFLTARSLHKRTKSQQEKGTSLNVPTNTPPRTTAFSVPPARISFLSHVYWKSNLREKR